MELLLERLERITALLPDKSAVHTPMVWHSNGERGYRHSNPHCHKLPRRSSKRVTTQSSIIEVLHTRPCPDCTISGFLDRQPAARELALLLRTQEHHKRWHEHAAAASELADLQRSLEAFRQSLGALESIRTSAEAMAAYGRHVERLQKSIERSLSKAQAQMRKRGNELIAPSALLTMVPNRRSSELNVAEKSEQALFGDTGGRYGTPARTMSLYERWEEMQRSGAPRERRDAELLKIAAGFPLQATSQLASIPREGLPGGEENLLEAITRAWKDEVARVTLDLAERWDRRFAELTGRTHDVLAAVYTPSWFARGMDEQVVEAFRVHTRGDGHVVIVRGPAVVLERMHASTSGGYGMSAVQLAEDETDAAVIETAAGLWDPQGQGTYQTFPAALEAARAIMA